MLTLDYMCRNLMNRHDCGGAPLDHLLSSGAIHAAGMYIPERMTESVFDYVVSSYTPTIGSLLRDGSTDLQPINSFKMMVAIQPTTPNQTSLPSTLDELQKIKDHVPANHLVKLVCGSVKEILSHLPTVSIAHLLVMHTRTHKTHLTVPCFSKTGR